MRPQPVEIGTERQLFLDDSWFDRRQNVKLHMHTPRLREVALTADQPWESAGVHYPSVVEDGGRYRMWYRSDEGDVAADRTWTTWGCYAESADGVRWEKPDLGLVPREGSTDNNIVLPNDVVSGSNPSVIIDPNAPSDERFKMITRTREINGYVSADGLSWRSAETNPFLTEGPFDSHNILVWDDEAERYVIYMRAVGVSVPGPFKGGHRAIRRSESADFRTWSEPELVISADEDDPRDINFYTNAAVKYSRAAHAYLMFPMILYVDRTYPGAPYPGLSDTQFAISRDGVSWDRRFREPFISPGLDERNWVDRNPIMGQGLLQTSPDEISMYYSELYRSGGGASRLRRCTIRTDGFVSVRGPYVGWGEFTTPTLIYSGKHLELNYSTSGGGSILVELQEEVPRGIPGFTLGDCEEIIGDKVEGVVKWKSGGIPGNLAGRPVRLRFKLRDADLYAFRFRE